MSGRTAVATEPVGMICMICVLGVLGVLGVGVGAGIGGVNAPRQARQAGSKALDLENEAAVGGLGTPLAPWTNIRGDRLHRSLGLPITGEA